MFELSRARECRCQSEILQKIVVLLRVSTAKSLYRVEPSE